MHICVSINIILTKRFQKSLKLTLNKKSNNMYDLISINNIISNNFLKKTEEIYIIFLHKYPESSLRTTMLSR